MPRSLVTGAPSHLIVAAIRSLARSGDTCEAAWAGGRLSRRIRTRYARRTHTIASPSADPERFVSDVLELARSRSIDFVLPGPVAHIEALAERRDRVLTTTAALLPTPASLAIAGDKLRTTLHARDLGISTPYTVEVPDASCLDDLATEILYPAVLKIRRGSGVHQGLRYLVEPGDLRPAFDELCRPGSDTDGCFIQELLVGRGCDVCAVADRGRVVQTLTQDRLLTYPIAGGVGAVNATTDDDELRRIATRLLESLEWNGPAQVEFKRDARDGSAKLLEINPRFWGTLDLSIGVGIDFPSLCRDLALGRQVETERDYPVGVRYKFLFARGTLAYWQLIRRFGLAAARDRKRWRRTLIDLDLRDPLPDLLRCAGTLIALARGDMVRVGADLPSEWIPRPTDGAA